MNNVDSVSHNIRMGNLPVQPVGQAGHVPTGFYAKQSQLPMNLVYKVNLHLALVGHVDFARGAADILGWKIASVKPASHSESRQAVSRKWPSSNSSSWPSTRIANMGTRNGPRVAGVASAATGRPCEA